ncbi:MULTISPECIES: ABC transporter ATP-binding protein [Brachybacterium]|uniref:ABC transporter ATP-binding protein n=1 Tax=Brachybacterium TaxID=43668 RepID=UPI000DF3C6AE|nr:MULTISPECIES: ABC transporter ATP-binding protein [Brachybacterium]RCS64901.1 ABC transporter ATP-binding protein [Brachybacterium alimentarium]RCS71586.1 ABC transporter ATP-binding protein [Brachybacterium alimentarium]RCS82424.1 ABC transporter ATP-binding protein [Brachybacterium alimentarium]
MSARTSEGALTTWQLLRDVLDRRTKVKLLMAAVVSGILALLETAAIITVLPLVSIATGAPLDEGALGIVWRSTGSLDRSTFGLALVLAVVLLFIVKDVCTMAFTWWQTGFVARERVWLSVRIFRNVMQSPYVEFRRRSTGETFRTMTAAVGQTFNAMVSGLITMISGGLTVIAIVIALLVATPVQALLALLYFVAASLAYLRIVRPRIARAGDLMMSGSVESTIAGLQGLNGFKETKIRHSAEHFVRRFEAGITDTEQAAREGNFYSGITKYLLEILFILGIGVLLAVSFSTGSAQSAVGSLALFVAAGFRLLPNISMLVGAVNGFRMGRKSLEIVHEELLDSDTGTATEFEAEALPFRHSVRLEGLHFRYPGAEEEVLRGIDLDIPFGRSIALVGGSGAGKTTLVDVVLGLLSPSAGRVLIDGTEMTGKERAWQANVSMVAQDVFLTEDSIVQNILMDLSPDQADQERLGRAIEQAQLTDVISEMPEGLGTSAGEWGARLSGGQRQRVGIARALYREPKLLVLDEATSALDNETERKITETISALSGDVTVIVVAHRLSTVKNVDEIVYLQDGTVAGRGTFAELQRTNEDFAHLVRLGDLGGRPVATDDTIREEPLGHGLDGDPDE